MHTSSELDCDNAFSTNEFEKNNSRYKNVTGCTRHVTQETRSWLAISISVLVSHLASLRAHNPDYSSSLYALPARHLKPRCPSPFKKLLTWPKFRVWRPGQVPILPYATMEAPSAFLTLHPGDPPQLGQNNPPQGDSGFVDGSGPLFSMYFKLAGEEDKKLSENWTGDADGILVFVSRYYTSATSA